MGLAEYCSEPAGHGVSSHTQLHLVDTTVARNSAWQPCIHGFPGTTLSMTRCAVTDHMSSEFVGGMYFHGWQITLTDVIFARNRGVQVAHGVLITDLFSQAAHSVWTNVSFIEHDGSLPTLLVASPIYMHCQLGHYMPRMGAMTANFTGCFHECPAGVYGDDPFNSDAQCSGACVCSQASTPGSLPSLAPGCSHPLVGAIAIPCPGWSR